MIVSFADQGSEDLFHGRDSRYARKIPKSLWKVARRKLDMIEYAATMDDLKVPPNNHLEKLKGDLKGFYSIRINQQYRVVFRFANAQASKVRILDYHS